MAAERAALGRECQWYESGLSSCPGSLSCVMGDKSGRLTCRNIVKV